MSSPDPLAEAQDYVDSLEFTGHAIRRLALRFIKIHGRAPTDIMKTAKALAWSSRRVKLGGMRTRQRIHNNDGTAAEYRETPCGWRLVLDGRKVITFERVKPEQN